MSLPSSTLSDLRRSVPLLELRDVSKRYGELRAVDGVSLRVEAGKTTALIGPSGCGKSTLLRLCNGLIWPDAGEVRCRGEALTRDNVLTMRRRMGYVIQEGGLFPHLRARDNVALLARHLGWAASAIEQRMGELRELVQLPPEALDRYPRQLSGGQRQRVSLMRALMLSPDLLLLDEPMGALDPLMRAELQVDLRRLFIELRQSVLIVTHDLAEAATLADHIVLLRSGRIVQQGSFYELAHAPADPFVTRFLEAHRFEVRQATSV